MRSQFHIRKDRRVIQSYRFGYRLWKIAEMERITVDEVLWILVEAGVIHENTVERSRKRGR